jgi:hypothetical protein
MEAGCFIVTRRARSLLGTYSEVIAIIMFLPKAYADNRPPVMRGATIIPNQVEAKTSFGYTADKYGVFYSKFIAMIFR